MPGGCRSHHSHLPLPRPLLLCVCRRVEMRSARKERSEGRASGARGQRGQQGTSAAHTHQAGRAACWTRSARGVSCELLAQRPCATHRANGAGRGLRVRGQVLRGHGGERVEGVDCGKSVNCEESVECGVRGERAASCASGEGRAGRGGCGEAAQRGPARRMRFRPARRARARVDPMPPPPPAHHAASPRTPGPRRAGLLHLARQATPERLARARCHLPVQTCSCADACCCRCRTRHPVCPVPLLLHPVPAQPRAAWHSPHAACQKAAPPSIRGAQKYDDCGTRTHAPKH